MLEWILCLEESLEDYSYVDLAEKKSDNHQLEDQQPRG